MKKEDLRFLKTKASIYRSLNDLLKTKTYDEIKVSDICEKSSINRSTFYDHYKDKNELLNSYIEDKKIEIKELIKEKSTIKEILPIILDYIDEEKELLIKLSNSKIKDIIIESIIEVLDKKNIIENIFYTSAIINTIFYYLLEDTFNKEEIKKNLNKLLKQK